MSSTNARTSTARQIPARLRSVIDTTDTRPIEEVVTSAARTVLMMATAAWPPTRVIATWESEQHDPQNVDIIKDALEWLGFDDPVGQQYYHAALSLPVLVSIRDQVERLYREEREQHHPNCDEWFCCVGDEDFYAWDYHYDNTIGYHLIWFDQLVPDVHDPREMIAHIRNHLKSLRHAPKRSFDDYPRHFAAGL